MKKTIMITSLVVGTIASLGTIGGLSLINDDSPKQLESNSVVKSQLVGVSNSESPRIEVDADSSALKTENVALRADLALLKAKLRERPSQLVEAPVEPDWVESDWVKFPKQLFEKVEFKSLTDDLVLSSEFQEILDLSDDESKAINDIVAKNIQQMQEYELGVAEYAEGPEARFKGVRISNNPESFSLSVRIPAMSEAAALQLKTNFEEAIQNTIGAEKTAFFLEHGADSVNRFFAFYGKGPRTVNFVNDELKGENRITTMVANEEGGVKIWISSFEPDTVAPRYNHLFQIEEERNQ